ncbi:MAG: serine hydrolase domain-containing protein [Marinicellaceae bacterium]
MNIKPTLYLTTVLLLIGTLAFAKPKHSTEEKIATFLNNLSEDDFSGTILVAHNDKIIDKKAYGFSSIEFNVKNNTDTKFNIASITKLFTSVAILQLYDQGKVKLDTPIGKYLPDYPNKEVRESVTIKQLLTHTTGLNNFISLVLIK